jgi:class 3 adenylate cyclase/predicted ATPase
MRCAKCGSDNREGRKFCAKCGVALAHQCARCGASNEPGEDFCGECGAALAAIAVAGDSLPQAASSIPDIRITPEQPDTSTLIDGERKTVTALFADIKGSTELMEDLDPEQARAIIDPALKLMIQAARCHDGYVVQSTGDGIFALFGAPVAHEDHPQRALYAALRIQEELERYSAKVVTDGGGPVQVRVGINTGEVVVRSIQTGASQFEYTPIGHTNNLASRLQTLAPAGSIAVSEHTRKLVEGYFELRSLGPMVVRGINEEVKVYEVTGLGSLRTHFEHSARRGLTKFVGRERELEQMKHALDLAICGQGQVVAVMAEAGTGKSRLFHEFKATIPTAYKVLEAYSVSHGKASAWLPVLELLRGYFGFLDIDDVKSRREKISNTLKGLGLALGDALPYVFGLFGVLEGPDSSDQLSAQIKRQRTLNAIKRIVLSESLKQPVVMILEDLHWIDEETQAFLNLLFESIGSSKVLLLVNHRPEYIHQWSNKTYYTQINLDPLAKESAERMLSALLGESDELIPVKRLIIERTEGVPFFMEEIVLALFEDGVLQRNGIVKLAKSIKSVKVPTTVQAILASRIDRLAPQEKDLLQALAVIGREGALLIIRRVVGRADDYLNRMLADLQIAEFIYEEPTTDDIKYTFKHALTQEVAYDSLLIERRKLLHQRVGIAMESLYAEHLEDHFGELAHHFSRTDDVAKGLEYQRKAGDQAHRMYAYSTAVAHFTKALELTSRMPWSNSRDQQELTLRLSLGTTLIAITSIGSPIVHENFSRARELCRSQRESPEVLHTLFGLCWFYIGRGELDTARELGKEMLELVENSPERLPWLLTDSAFGPALVWSGNFAYARIRLEHGYAFYDPNRPDQTIITDFGVICLSYLAFTLWSLGFPDQASIRVQESLVLAGRLGHVHSIGHALVSVALFNWFRRDLEGLKEYAEAAIAFSIEHELAFWEPMGTILDGCALSQRGEKERSSLEIERGLAAYRATGSELSLPMFLGGLIESYKKADRIEEALGTLGTAFAMIDKGRFYEAELFRHKGELLMMRNPFNIEEVKQSFRSAIEVARHQNAKAWELRATMSLARVLAKLQRRDEARGMLADIYNWFTEGFETADLKDAKALLDELSA